MGTFASHTIINSIVNKVWSDLSLLQEKYNCNIVSGVAGDKSKLSEEDFKNGLIVPFMEVIGFDKSNLTHVRGEYDAGIRSNNHRPCDFVLFHSDDNSKGPSVAIEAKKWGFDIGKQGNVIDAFKNELSDVSQLKEYFIGLRGKYPGKNLKIGILSDGLTYYFYRDSVNANIMDVYPFYKLNIEELFNSQSKLDLIVLYLLNRKWGTSQLDTFIKVAERVTMHKKWVAASCAEMSYLSEDQFKSSELGLLNELVEMIPVDIPEFSTTYVENSISGGDFIPVKDIDISKLIGTRPSSIKIGDYIEDVSKWTKCLDIILGKATCMKSASVLVAETEQKLHLGGLTQKFLFDKFEDLTCKQDAINNINGAYYRSHLGAKDVVARAIIIQDVIGEEISVKYSNMDGSIESVKSDKDDSSYNSVMSLTSKNVVGVKPSGVKILGDTIDISSWRNLYIEVMHKILSVMDGQEVVKRHKLYINSISGVSKEFLFSSEPNIKCRDGYITEIKGVYFYNNLSADALLPRLCVLMRVLDDDISIKLVNKKCD